MHTLQRSVLTLKNGGFPNDGSNCQGNWEMHATLCRVTKLLSKCFNLYCQFWIIWMALITVVLGTNTQEAVGLTITYNLPSQQELCSFYEFSHLNSLQYLIMIDIDYTRGERKIGV